MNRFFCASYGMEEAHDGEWVKYEDHLAALAARDEERCVWVAMHKERGKGTTGCGRKWDILTADTTRPCWCGKPVEVK